MGVVQDIFKKSNNPIAELVERGWVYDLSEAAFNTAPTGTITLANTTPLLLLALAAQADPLCAIPLYLSLCQTGTVAGGAVTVIMEKDNANRLTSGGTDATVLNARMTKTHSLPSGATMRSRTDSGITATNAYGIRMWGVTVGQDVSPAEGVPNELVWTPPAGPDYIEATADLGASWLIFADAGTTGPTLFWSARVAIFPASQL